MQFHTDPIWYFTRLWWALVLIAFVIMAVKTIRNRRANRKTRKTLLKDVSDKDAA